MLSHQQVQQSSHVFNVSIVLQTTLLARWSHTKYAFWVIIGNRFRPAEHAVCIVLVSKCFRQRKLSITICLKTYLLRHWRWDKIAAMLPNSFFLNENYGISNEITLKFAPVGSIDKKSTLGKVMAWHEQRTSFYLNRFWSNSLTHTSVTQARSNNPHLKRPLKAKRSSMPHFLDIFPNIKTTKLFKDSEFVEPMEFITRQPNIATKGRSILVVIYLNLFDVEMIRYPNVKLLLRLILLWRILFINWCIYYFNIASILLIISQYGLRYGLMLDTRHHMFCLIRYWRQYHANSHQTLRCLCRNLSMLTTKKQLNLCIASPVFHQ